MAVRGLKVRVALAVFAAAITAAPLLSITDVSAANVWSGRSARYGYFKNQFGHSDSPYTCAGHVGSGPVVDNNCYKRQSIPDNIDNKSEIQKWLKDTYNGGSTWEKVGVAFIVNTMLGRQANNVGTDKDASLDASEWNELAKRLDTDQVTAKDEFVKSSTYGSIDTYYQYKNRDVAYYKDSESGNALVFRDKKGRALYVLLHKCANPLGDLEGLPENETNEDPSWKVTPDTDVSVDGNTIKWSHSVVNNGPDKTDAVVKYRFVNGDGFTPGAGPDVTYPSGRTANDSDGFNSTVNFDPVTDGGKRFCRATQATPRSRSNASPITSAYQCYTVPVSLNYELAPFTKFSDGGTSTSIEPGQTGTQVYYGVTNSGPSTSPETDWQLTRCVYGAGSGPALSTGTTNDQSAATTYGGTCGTVGVNTDTYGVGTKTYDPPATEDAAGAAVGTVICYVMTVTPPGSSTDGYRHSPPACIKVLKSPKIQILGADGRAGSIRTAPAKNLGGQYYGSWSEYGIFGVGGITGMGSGASLAGGGATNQPNRLNALTFANNGSGGCQTGCFYSGTPTDDYYTAYAALATRTTGSLAYGGFDVGDPRMVIRVNGDLTINGDIAYPGTYGSLAQIPRMIFVVSGNVTVAPGVGRIDAWIITKGSLRTCSDFTGDSDRLTAGGTCSAQLRFNGPVIADNVRLGRTYGADIASRADAAEVFNLAPGNYLSSYSESASSSNVATVYEKELPPRW